MVPIWIVPPIRTKPANWMPRIPEVDDNRSGWTPPVAVPDVPVVAIIVPPGNGYGNNDNVRIITQDDGGLILRSGDDNRCVIGGTGTLFDNRHGVGRGFLFDNYGIVIAEVLVFVRERSVRTGSERQCENSDQEGDHGACHQCTPDCYTTFRCRAFF